MITTTSSREIVLDQLRKQLHVSARIVAVACGSGLAAKRVIEGGADLILAINSGRFRQMGVGSLAGYMPYTNANEQVMDFATKELLPLKHKIPIIFGLNATDPSILLPNYIRTIKELGFHGISNYPSVGLVDGIFGEALEEQGFHFGREVEAMRIAKDMGLFTFALVFNESHAYQMLEAKVDVICVHLGLTKGGDLGAKRVLSLDRGTQLIQTIFNICDETDTKAIKIVCGGPINSPTDLEYVYNQTTAQGYIGGSTFDRLPAEMAITEQTKQFKSTGQVSEDLLLQQMLQGIQKNNYVQFVKKYIEVHYMNPISFTDLATVVGITRTHLSNLFRAETGMPFPVYLNNYRIQKARGLIDSGNFYFYEISLAVGYNSYAYFCKTFKRIVGSTPKTYADSLEKN